MSASPEHGRILCVTSNFPRWGGDSTTPFVLHLAQDLQRLGWHVDVLAPHAPGASRAELLGGVHVERFRYAWPERSQTVCYQGGALINLRKRPSEHLKLPVLVAAEISAVLRRLRSGHYDLLHSHWILPQGFAGMIARRLRPTRQVITVHGGDVFGLRGRFMLALKRAALRDADAVTVNSSATEKAVGELVPVISNLRRIPMGIAAETPGAHARQQAILLARRICPRAEPLLLFVGRLVDEKGVEDLLHALALLKQQGRPFRALILGEGQDRESLEHLSAEMGLNSVVCFTGWVDPQHVPIHLLAADMLIAPSRTAANGWVEAQGLSLLEAMALGTPVIATRCGGIPDAVQHEHTGLLVDERCPDQLAAAIARLIADSGLRARLAEAARQRATNRFSREASAYAFSELMSAVMHMGQRRVQHP